MSFTKRFFLIVSVLAITVFHYSCKDEPDLGVQSITLDKKELTLAVGEVETIKPSVSPENAPNKNVTWKSSNPEVASVISSGGNGIVAALEEGETTITATTHDGNKTAVCKITVTPLIISVEGVILSTENLFLGIGDTNKIEAEILPDNASNKNVVWTSGNDDIATVSEEGLVSGISIGETIIMATSEDGGKQATCKVTVQGIIESFKSPSILFTREELTSLKAAINGAGNGSLKNAYQNLISRSNNGLNHEPSVYSGTDSYTFLQSVASSSSFARDLALSYHLTGNKDYADKSIEILSAWAAGSEGITYGVEASSSMYLARSMFPMICAYDLMKSTGYVSGADRANIEAWFASIFPQIKSGVDYWEENDYFNKQEYQNHVVAHMMGILAIGLVLEDMNAVKFALNSPDNPRDFRDLIAGCIFMKGDTPHHREDPNSAPPETGEIYDRYRHKTGPVRGLQYSHLTLTLLTTAARMCHNNGLDMFAYTAPTGENIGLSFTYYADFYRLMDSCIKTGFYCGETERIGKAGDDHGLFEIGMRYYPDVIEIKNMVYSGSYDRGTNHSTLLGFYRFFSVPVDLVK